MDSVRKNTLTKSRLIPSKVNHVRGTYKAQAVGMMERRKINKYPHAHSKSQFYGGNHITVSRNNDGYITKMVVRIIDNLRGYSNVRFLLLISLNKKPTVITFNGLPKILSQDQLEFRVFLISLKKSVLSQNLIMIIRPGRKVLHGNQLLIGFHKLFEEFYYVKPIITSPSTVLCETVIEIKAINIYYNFLFFHHIQK